MRRASRFMPKYDPSQEHFSFLRIAVAVLVSGGMIYAFFTFPLLLLMVPVFVAWTYLDNKKSEQKFAALALERNGLGICEYARSLEFRKLDTWVIRAVYEGMQDYVGSVPIKADDDLFELLEIDEEDLEDMLMDIAQRTRHSLDSTESNPYFGKVRTVRDLVHFIDAQPRLKDDLNR